jgi:protein TilB
MRMLPSRSRSVWLGARVMRSIAPVAVPLTCASVFSCVHLSGARRALTRLCPELQILYLQHNLIGKIENLRRLRDLDYLNLALNNILKVENLERNEKLRKLDLTVNFIDIDGLLSVESLKVNHQLEELYMTGNPCTEFEQYRAFIIGTLPQLKRLDGKPITATERIQAQQDLKENRARLVVAAKDRVRQKGGNPDLVDAESVPVQEVDSDEDGADLYGYSPEIRLSDYKREEKKKQREKEENLAREKERDPFKAAMEQERANRKLIKEDGTVRLINDGKWPFTMDEDDKEGTVIAKIMFPKFLDTSMLDIDIQPTYFRVTLRKPEKHDKVIQITFPCEVRPDDASAQRSQNTGELKLVCPKLHWVPPEKMQGDVDFVDEKPRRRGRSDNDVVPELGKKGGKSGGSIIGGLCGKGVSVRNMVDSSPNKAALDMKEIKTSLPNATAPTQNDDFEDDPDCPPLE